MSGDFPIPKFVPDVFKPTPEMGWRCPNCGAGLSPATSRCPCVPLPLPRMPGSA